MTIQEGVNNLERNMMTECWDCKHRQDVPGNCHIMCRKPDRNMTGDPHGIRKGWFLYPVLFDPTWKTKLCDNYDSISPAVSQAVSPETNALHVPSIS